METVQTTIATFLAAGPLANGQLEWLTTDGTIRIFCPTPEEEPTKKNLLQALEHVHGILLQAETKEPCGSELCKQLNYILGRCELAQQLTGEPQTL